MDNADEYAPLGEHAIPGELAPPGDIAKLANTEALLNAKEIRDLAEVLDVSPRKPLGQNFVVDANTVRKIVTAAQVRADDVVLEIGSGLGSLTLGLLAVNVPVIAVEVDERLASGLPHVVAAQVEEGRLSASAGDQLTVINADALQVQELPIDPSILVANLPYNVAVPVVLHALASFPSLHRVLVMVQKEVAERLSASPGNKIYGVPSVKAAWYSQVSLAGMIGRNVFWPTPNVDSALVAFNRRPQPLGSEAERKATFTVINAAFAQRRKTLRAALRSWAGGTPQVTTILEQAQIDPQARGETLSVEEFLKIARAGMAFTAAEG